MLADEAVSGVLSRDFADLLGDFTGEPANELLSASLDFEDVLFVGELLIPFNVGACEKLIILIPFPFFTNNDSHRLLFYVYIIELFAEKIISMASFLELSKIIQIKMNQFCIII